MSGLCGIIHFGERPADEAGLRAMEAAAAHRASEGAHRWLQDGCGLSHLASHLHPEEARTRQPVISRDQRYVIVADVRIDNRDELRTALRSPGPAGQGDPRVVASDAGDAELVLEAFCRWGDACLEHFIGDYAFAIWDRRDRRLFAARDPMAMRPFYYRAEGERLVFASEIGAILDSGGVPRRLYRPMAAAWLMIRAGAPEWTFFEGIRELPGAHRLTADASGLQVGQIWDVDIGQQLAYRSDDDYVEHFRGLLLSATRARLQGEHPAGMLLSGGLDSCVVAGAAGWLMEREPIPAPPGPMTTFSYRYEGFPQCDERHVSEPLAKHWGMRIEEVSSDEWRPGTLLSQSWDLDSPMVALYRPLQDAAMERAQAQGIRQMFIAARGDNMVGSYIWDHAGLLASGAFRTFGREFAGYRRLYGTGAWKTFRKTVLLPGAFALTSMSPSFAARRARGHMESVERKLAGGRLADPWVPRELLREIPLSAILGRAEPRGFRSAASRARYDAVFDRFTELGNAQVERRAATYGLRYEDPWSDRRILEFVCAVPQHVLNRMDDTKRLARRALSGLAPAQVQTTAQKIIPAPFGVHALRTREADSLVELTTGMRAARAGLVDETKLSPHIRDFLQGAEFISGAWPAITLEAWLRANDVEV